MGYVAYYESPLGPMTLSSDGVALTGLWFDGQKHFGVSIGENPQESGLPVFDDTCRWLDAYFSGSIPGFSPLVSADGTAFQKMVWQILMDVPYGDIVTYGDIARAVARRSGVQHMSARAVGCAVGRNPVSLLIPCHRVVGASGRLTGYAGGLDRKRMLLELEKTKIHSLSVGYCKHVAEASLIYD